VRRDRRKENEMRTQYPRKAYPKVNLPRPEGRWVITVRDRERIGPPIVNENFVGEARDADRRVQQLRRSYSWERFQIECTFKGRG
jgi:hypothetical protein